MNKNRNRKKIIAATETISNELVEIDIYGEIKFGEYDKISKYVKIKHDSPIDEVFKVSPDKNVFNVSKIEMNMPKLIISVTGGAQNFHTPQNVKNAFKLGLIKAATSTNTLIITGGTNTGVMKLVGEAIVESVVDLSKVTVLGIATWGKVADRENLLATEKCIDYHPEPGNDVKLDPNHTHFILADDGSTGKFGVEIEFRSNLEKKLKNCLVSEKIPTILIVVQGGHNTLGTVMKAVENDVPILVLEGSRGCADLIANLQKIENKSDENLKFFSKEFKDFALNGDSLTTLEKIFEKPDLINVFKLNSEQDSEDIEFAILKAFLASHKDDNYENLKLAIKWNQIEVARANIFTGLESFKENQLFDLLEIAIIENKPDFVELFIENNVDLVEFLTRRRLLFLYNFNKKLIESKRAPIAQMLKLNQKTDNAKKRVATFDIIEKLCLKIDLENKISFNFLPAKNPLEKLSDIENFNELANKYGKSEFSENRELFENFGVEETGNASQNLFFWAILHNRIEIAKIFWRVGRYQIINALFACVLLRKMANQVKDLQAELLKHADYFEDLAISIIEIFDDNTEDEYNLDILMCEIKYFNLNILEMAELGDCKKFISQPTVQNILTSVWLGQESYKTGFTKTFKFLISCLSLGILTPFLYSKDEWQSINEWIPKMKKFEKQNDTEIEQTAKTDEEKQKYNLRNFLQIPRVRFFYDSLSYFIFLLLFSYVILCDFNFKKQIQKPNSFTSTDIINERFDKNNEENVKISLPSTLEFVIVGWVFALFCEEVRQLMNDGEGVKVKLMIKAYFNDSLNYFDILGCFLFFVGATLRILSYFKDDEDIFVAARLTFCVDLTIWYMRILNVALVFQSLGPKLVMIQRMTKDLLFFIYIIAVFVFAFGVTTQATLYPNTPLSFGLIRDIINKAYWPIFGEMKIYDEELGLEAVCFEDECPEESGKTFTLIALMIYMIAGNVLLINLLIAMFSSIYQDVQENTEQIWKFQRYRLIFDYKDLLILPPPFTLIIYIFKFFKIIGCRNCSNQELKTMKIKNIQMYESKIELGLHNDEKKYAEMYLRREKIHEKEKIDNKMRLNFEKLEEKLNEIIMSREKYFEK